MIPKRLLALSLFAALAVMPPCVLRAQWVQTNLYIDEQVQCFASVDSVLFAGTDGGGIFKSLDQGRYWIPSNNGLPTNSIIMALAVSGVDIIASTEDSSVYLSTDAGLNWYPARSGLLNEYSSYPYTFGFFTDSMFLFAATASGIYRSSNNGADWFFQDTGIESPQFAYFQIFSKSSSFLFAGGGDCFFRSSDDGNSWVQADSGLTQAGYVYSLIVLGNSIFAGTSHGIYLSTNNGDYWTAENSSIPANPRVNCFANIDSGGIAVMFAGTNDGVYISSDSGSIWVERDAGLPLDHRISSFSMVGNMLLIGTAFNGVFASTDLGLTWDTSNTGLPITSPTIESLLATDSSVYAGGDGIFRSSDDGAHWNSVGAQVSLVTYALALCGQNLLAGTEGGISLSTNSGTSWKSVYTQPISSFAVNGNYVYAGGYGGAYYSSDAGEHWTPINFNLSISLDGSAVSLATDDSFLYAGTGDVFNDGAVIRSSDSGSTWIFDETGVASWYNIAGIAVEEGDSSPSNNLFAFGENLLFRSINSGESWDLLDTILPNSSEAYINAVAADDSIVFAGISGSNDTNGVILSTDNGTSWKWDNSGLPANPQLLAFAFKDTTVFAGSYTSGVWKRFGVQPVILPQELVQTSLSTITNLEVFPNPCRSTTTITFTSPTSGYAEASIVNMLGVEVARLFSGELGAGEHNVSWSNPAGLQDGVYECLVPDERAGANAAGGVDAVIRTRTWTWITLIIWRDYADF